MDRRTEFARGIVSVAAAVFVAGCAPERNGPGMLPTPLPMPPRPVLQYKEMRCFDSEMGLAHRIDVDPEGNEYVSGDAIRDETCLTPTPKVIATPIP